MSRECQILRVFTREETGGNHLGVVTDLYTEPGCRELGIDPVISAARMSRSPY